MHACMHESGTQPGLPLKKGRGPTMTHDYKRNGTTTLFAALNVLDGSVIGQNMQRHPLPGSASSLARIIHQGRYFGWQR